MVISAEFLRFLPSSCLPLWTADAFPSPCSTSPSISCRLGIFQSPLRVSYLLWIAPHIEGFPGWSSLRCLRHLAYWPRSLRRRHFRWRTLLSPFLPSYFFRSYLHRHYHSYLSGCHNLPSLLLKTYPDSNLIDSVGTLEDLIRGIYLPKTLLHKNHHFWRTNSLSPPWYRFALQRWI